ncbi:MAG: class I SAM-dependent methyltransferase [Acidimicrobiales bacterium]|nr:class I SAM-dependent methyltransferase [Acidimicrobiales bacterium]
MTTSDDAALDGVLERSRRLGYLGPGSLRVQIDHARGFAAGLGTPPQRFLDLGSGGGLPGLVLALHWPASQAVLLDASARRCAFLAEAVAELGCDDRVSVVRARAEDAGRRPELRGAFDAVVARGFGPPAVTAECGAPFLVVGGHLVVSEPPGDDGEATADVGAADCARPHGDAAVDVAGRTGPLRGATVDVGGGGGLHQNVAPGDRWPADGLAQLGLASERTWSDPFHYRSLVLESTCPETYPRRDGVPAKRPLF